MFSVIIPLYNKELSIENTINSVLKQSFSDFEIIIVNDGSTDNSLFVVNQINDRRIKIFDKQNGGVSSARNYGIDKATFEWISFLDGDDLWEINHLEEVYKMINKFPNEKIFATSFKYSDNRVLQKLNKKEEIFKIDNYFKDSLIEHLIWTSILTCNRSCLNEIKFDKHLKLGEDLIFFSQLMNKYSLVKSSKVTAIYKIDAENRSDLGDYKMQFSYLSIIDFKNMQTIDEKKYFKKLVIQKLKHFIVRKDYKNVLFLIKKYNFNLFF